MLGAFIFFLATMATPLLAVQAFGDRSDAVNRGAIQIAEATPQLDPNLLDDTLTEFPDLLANEVALGENPTLALRNSTNSPTPQNKTIPETLAMVSDTPVDQVGPRVIKVPQRKPAPPLDKSLTRRSEFGPVPAPDAQGRSPLSVYQNTDYTRRHERAVAIIVGGLGINPELTARAIDELPATVTLSFASQSPNLQRWMDRARAAGHEVLLEIPMEAATSASEPRVLQSSTPSAEIVRNLEFHLSRAQGYIGIINYNGERLLTRSDKIGPMLDSLAASGLGLFVDGSFETPSLSALSRSVTLPYGEGFGQIDPSADRSVVSQRLSALAQQATTEHSPIGVGFVFPETLDVLKGWTATLDNEGLDLIPASAALTSP